MANSSTVVSDGAEHLDKLCIGIGNQYSEKSTQWVCMPMMPLLVEVPEIPRMLGEVKRPRRSGNWLS